MSALEQFNGSLERMQRRVWHKLSEVLNDSVDRDLRKRVIAGLNSPIYVSVSVRIKDRVREQMFEDTQ